MMPYFGRVPDLYCSGSTLIIDIQGINSLERNCNYASRNASIWIWMHGSSARIVLWRIGLSNPENWRAQFVIHQKNIVWLTELYDGLVSLKSVDISWETFLSVNSTDLLNLK
jgi:hypothetical protein